MKNMAASIIDSFSTTSAQQPRRIDAILSSLDEDESGSVTVSGGLSPTTTFSTNGGDDSSYSDERDDDHDDDEDYDDYDDDDESDSTGSFSDHEFESEVRRAREKRQARKKRHEERTKPLEAQRSASTEYTEAEQEPLTSDEAEEGQQDEYEAEEEVEEEEFPEQLPEQDLTSIDVIPLHQMDLPEPDSEEIEVAIPNGMSDVTHGTNEPEVEYGSGNASTALYEALESSDWRRALDVLESDPKQASTWVTSASTGNELGVLWRRLPLHEACRGGAPAWLISALLSVNPSAACQSTKFGELPLHCAVECRASPEVVNLLLVSYWPAIVATDQSGRTPLQVLLEGSEKEDLEDHKTVAESLERAHHAWNILQDDHVAELQEQRKDNTEYNRAVEAQHQQQMRRKEETVKQLKRQVQELETHLETSNQMELKLHSQLDSMEERDLKAQRMVLDLQNQVAQVAKARDGEIQHVRELHAVINSKDEEIRRRDQEIKKLHTTLQRIALFQQREVIKTVRAAEDRMFAMIDSFGDVQNILTKCGTDMDEILKDCGVSPIKYVEEEKKSDKDVEDDVTFDEAMMSAALAASSALNVSAITADTASVASSSIRLDDANPALD